MGGLFGQTWRCGVLGFGKMRVRARYAILTPLTFHGRHQKSITTSATNSSSREIVLASLPNSSLGEPRRHRSSAFFHAVGFGSREGAELNGRSPSVMLSG